MHCELCIVTYYMLYMNNIMEFLKRKCESFLVIICTAIFVQFGCFAEYKEIDLGRNELLASIYVPELDNVDSLKITGFFHEKDIVFIKENLSATISSHSNSHFYKKGNLSYLDLSQAQYVNYYGVAKMLPEKFGNGLAVSELKLPVLKIDRYSFCDNPFLKIIGISPNTEIGMYCFENCDAIETIYIPKDCKASATSFRSKSLKSIIVDKENEYYTSIDGMMLDKEGKSLLAVPYGLKKVKIPDSVEFLDGNAFYEHPNIEVIQLGSNVSELSSMVFYFNKRLDRIIIKSHVPMILPELSNGQYKYFIGCDHLTRCGYLYVPKGTKQYYEGARGWKEIPNIIEYSDNELSMIYEKSIEDDPYGYDYDFKVDDLYYKVISFEDNTVGVVNGYVPYIGHFEIPEEITYKNRNLKVTSILSMSNGDITNLKIPESITSIGDLSGNSFSSIILPSTLLELGNRVFSHCENLNTIDIPDGIRNIPSDAFRGCYNLETVNWRPSQFGNIGSHAFVDCFSLRSFIFTPKMRGTGGNLGYRGTSSFDYCCSLDSIAIEDGASLELGFYYDSKEGKYNGEFFGCNITKLYMGGNYSYSSYYYGCWPNFTSLEELTIGDNLEKIEKWPYNGNLKKIVIGASLKELPSFSSNTVLEEIKVKALIPPIAGEFSSNSYLNTVLYVPTGSISLYKEAPIWKNFWSIKEFDKDASKGYLMNPSYKQIIGIYDINGIRHDVLTKGLNIIKYSDGSVEKICN